MATKSRLTRDERAAILLKAIRILLEEKATDERMKQLVIDEMEDYVEDRSKEFNSRREGVLKNWKEIAHSFNMESAKGSLTLEKEKALAEVFADQIIFCPHCSRMVHGKLEKDKTNESIGNKRG